MSSPILEAKKLFKTYGEGKLKTPVLKDFNFSIQKGEVVAIIGASGSGKSTVLQLLGGLDTPTKGTVSIAGQSFHQANENTRAKYRNAHIGFVYQFHHLLPEFSAVENVAMPLLIRGDKTAHALEKAKKLLSSVGLSKRLNHKPSELSGGERQRTAIARALITQPDVILADEPTGNLDSTTAREVFALLLSLNQSHNTALVIVTHDQQLAAQCEKQLVLS